MQITTLCVAVINYTAMTVKSEMSGIQYVSGINFSSGQQRKNAKTFCTLPNIGHSFFYSDYHRHAFISIYYDYHELKLMIKSYVWEGLNVMDNPPGKQIHQVMIH